MKVIFLCFQGKKGIGILLPKLFWPTVRKKCSRDREKLLKFEAEGREIAKNYSKSESLEQFLAIWTIRFQIRKNYWDLETYRKGQKIFFSDSESKLS